MEAKRLVAQPALDNFFQSDKSAATDEKNVRRVNGEEFLMRMFAPALRWNVGDGAFQNFQQGLLYAFARNVASDRWVLILSADLIDLIDVNNALLRAFDVAVGGLKKFQDDVLDVFADVAGFGERRCIDDRERHAQ